MKRKINKEEVLNLYHQGLSDRQIGKELGFSFQSIGRCRRELLGIQKSLKEQHQSQRYYYNYYNIFENKELLAALCGTILGDGSLSKSSSKSAKGSIAHCKEQFEYLQYKMSLLKDIITDNKIAFYMAKEKQRGKYLIKKAEYCRLQLKSSPYLNILREMMYPSGKKQFTIDIIPFLSDISIALFYFDDGYKHYQTNGLGFHYRLTNYAFSNESKELFVKFLKQKFNIESAIHKGYFYIAKRESVLIFQNILNKYKVKCMEYKI